MLKPMQTTTSTGNSDEVARNQYIQSRIAGEKTYPSATSGSVEDPFMPPPRKIFNRATGKWEDYSGPGLVNSQGILLVDGNGRPFYYTEGSAEQILFNMSAAERAKTMQKLVSAGFIDKSRVGDYNSEANALFSAMTTANFNGLELQYALDKMIEGRPVSMNRTGAVRTYTKTATQDIVAAAKRLSMDMTGRELDDAMAGQFADQYQQQEVAYQRSAYAGGTIMQPPSIDTALSKFIEGAMPKESGAYKYLGYMNKLFNMIGVQ